MKKLVITTALLCPFAYGNEADAPASEMLRVMLQGESAAAMAELVAAEGGELTHSLHIINAVGAVVSRQQLNDILATSKVTRHIDDLSLSEDPIEDEEESACKVGGALDLDYEGKGIAWRLFNKGTEPASITQLVMEWPEQLGYLESLRLGDQAIGIAADQGAVNMRLGDEAAPSLTGQQTLYATFSRPTAGATQAEFEIVASFGEDCETSLIPGYVDNMGNSYYPTVAGADNLHLNGVTGRGVAVAVLDSGLWEHPALKLDTKGKNRVIARYDAISDSTGEEVFDESGHGTHMTSVIAHSEAVVIDGAATGWFKGMAPDARLVAVKAFDNEGQGDFLDIVRGVQYVVDNRERYDIRVLNLSFAARPRWPYWQDPINQAIMRAWDAGITVVAAAGNEGPEPMSIGSPGNLPYIITVGAITDSWTLDTRDDDYIPDFSSRGPTPSAHIKPDIVAPGGHIVGITRPDSTLTREHPEYMLSTGDFVMTGTSQAAALVSGMVALLLQLEPDLTPDDVKCKLTSSAELAINKDGLLAYSPFQQGHGYVNATRAVTLGEKGCGNSEMELSRDLAGEDHYQGPAIMDEEGNVSLPGLDTMLSPETPAEGMSESRKWGVKDHLEREDYAPPDMPEAAPFDWEGLYERERAKIEVLSTSD